MFLCCLEAYWPYLAAACIAFGALQWLLSVPYRGVGAAHYDTPRRFLLTGCASGMGRHLTGVLLRRGHQVLATDLNDAQLREVAAADGWEALAREKKATLRLRALDVSNRGQWEAALAEVDRAWGGLDVCMNIAGLVIPRKIQDVQNPREIDLHIDVMVKGPIHGTQLAAALMARRGIKGHVINVSSMAAVGPVAGVTLCARQNLGGRCARGRPAPAHAARALAGTPPPSLAAAASRSRPTRTSPTWAWRSRA